MSLYYGIVVLHYKLVCKLGEGACGSVFLAEHESLGRKAAVKILHPEFASDNALVERFWGELKVVGPNASIDLQHSGYLASGEPFYLVEFSAGMPSEETSHVDERADVYALGATVFTALSGAPFAHQNSTKSLPQSEAPKLRTSERWVLSSVDEVLARCLSKNAEQRPASIALAWAAIAAASGDRVLADSEIPSLRKSVKPWLWAAVAVLATTIGGMALALRERSPTNGASSDTLVQAEWDARAPQPDAAAVAETPPVKRSTDPRCSVYDYLQLNNGIDSAEKAEAKLADFEVCLKEGSITAGQFVGVRESLIRDMGRFNRKKRSKSR